MKIHIEDFIRTGEFGPVRIGMSREEIIRELGEPDCVSNCGKRGWILQYSSYELFINRNDKLFALQNDNYDPMDPNSYGLTGERIEFNSWFLGSQEAKTPDEIADLLTSHAIQFSIVDYFGRDVIRSESGVIIDFSDENGNRELIGIRYWPSSCK